MRIVSWNCKGAFERKHEAVARLDPDILILPEAGRLDGLTQILGAKPVRSTEWIGENPQKGLGVISYGDYSLRVHEAFDPSLRWVLPLVVDGPNAFTLFAIWTVPNAPSNTYIQCLFDAFTRYESLIRSERVVVAGDFNNNVVFDKPTHPLKFRILLGRFRDAGLESLYHLDRKCEHGAEGEPTFFLHHASEKPHHIDFIFASEALRQRGFSVEVGRHSDWTKSSDHVPISCRFANV